MSYYSSTDWWNDRFKIRVPLSFTPSTFLPGDESLFGVKVLKQPLARKLKSDYSDLRVIYQPVGALPSVIPYFVLDEGTYVSIVFPPAAALTFYEPATPTGVQYAQKSGNNPIRNTTWATPPASQDEYFLYYSGKAESKESFGVEYMDPYDLQRQDLGQEDDQTRFAFSKPTIDWSNNKSYTAGARAIFEFTGFNILIAYKSGPQYGKFTYAVDGATPIEVDCYDTKETTKTKQIIDTQIASHKIRFKALGQRNPAATAHNVQIEYVNYDQVLLGVAESEEYLSNNGKAFTVGP